MSQAIQAIEYIHKNGFIHRDIKPENFLVSKKTQSEKSLEQVELKLGDFGLAKEIREMIPGNLTDYISTRWYRAPELLLRSRSYKESIDIFALGAIMGELYLNRPLFPGNSEQDQLTKIFSVLGTPQRNEWPDGYNMAQQKSFQFPQMKGTSLSQLISREISQDALDLLSNMLQFDSNKRFSARICLMHPFIKQGTNSEYTPYNITSNGQTYRLQKPPSNQASRVSQLTKVNQNTFPQENYQAQQKEQDFSAYTTSRNEDQNDNKRMSKYG